MRRPWLRMPTQLVSLDPCQRRCLEGGEEGDRGRTRGVMKSWGSDLDLALPIAYVPEVLSLPFPLHSKDLLHFQAVL